jgi:hypothetical protein
VRPAAVGFTLAAVGVGVFALVKSQQAQAEEISTCLVSTFCFGVLGSGMKLTPEQIAQVAQQAGFNGDNLSIAVAIAIAESGGDPHAYNPEVKAAGGTPVGLGSYGLWQVYKKKHPEFNGLDLNDPQTNANAAFSIFQQSGGFRPWSTYNSGAYTSHLYNFSCSGSCNSCSGACCV